jgi:hypothetical protein
MVLITEAELTQLREDLARARYQATRRLEVLRSAESQVLAHLSARLKAEVEVERLQHLLKKVLPAP